MHLRPLILALCLASMLGGCGGEEFVYSDGRDMKQGPGLLSGKDGVFTIYKNEHTPQEEQPAAEKTPSKPQQ
jgi:hypothetical protein